MQLGTLDPADVERREGRMARWWAWVGASRASSFHFKHWIYHFCLQRT